MQPTKLSCIKFYFHSITSIILINVRDFLVDVIYPCKKMITYELMLLLRIMPKVELISTLKRTALTLLDAGGIIRNLENLGTRKMPYRTSVHGMVYNMASYYLFEFTAPPSVIRTVLDEYGRDVDIIRRRIYKKMHSEYSECTLHEELQSPPYRRSVQELIEQTNTFDKPKFNYNTGYDYYPFQK